MKATLKLRAIALSCFAAYLLSAQAVRIEEKHVYGVG